MKLAPSTLVNKLSFAVLMFFVSQTANAQHLVVSGSMQQELRGEVGPFIVAWRGDVSGAESLVVSHRSFAARRIWHTVPGEPFVAFSVGREHITEARGSITVKDHSLVTCDQVFISDWQDEDDEVLLSGTVRGKGCAGSWTIRIHLVDDERLAVDVSGHSAMPRSFNRVTLRYAAPMGERVHGFGMQFTRFDLKGSLIPVITEEQGVGRGRQPLSWAVNATQGTGVAGDWSSSYATVPAYLSSAGYGIYLDQYEYAQFDLRRPSQSNIRVFAPHMALRLAVGRDYKQLVEVYTRWSGRMEALPEWVGRGAIVGVQGGLDRVRSVYQKLRTAGVAISALWIQDWVGRRQTTFGSQLWWNWELDEGSYPGLAAFAAELRTQGVRLLTYVNPFLADPSAKPVVKRNLFSDAKASGYLVMNDAGEPYMIQNTSFAAALIDLTDTDARHWFKNVLREQVMVTGASGWMADFGEALPYDAKLKSKSAKSYHNQYPEEWVKVNREALEDEGLWQDSLIFSRSAYSRSPGLARLFWLGDQLVSWDGYDGLQSALTGLLTGGFTGFSLNHSDTGGYTTIDNPLLKFHRSRELLQRWTELNAFSAVLRTHEGNIPRLNAQVYDDSESLAHFTKFSKIYAALTEYRQTLMGEAAASGMPLVRAVTMMYPDDAGARTLDREFMLGSDLLVCPVVRPRRDTVSCYLPPGHWRHIVSGQLFRQGWHRVQAPIGKPAVFFHERDVAAPQPEWLPRLTTLLRDDSAA